MARRRKIESPRGDSKQADLRVVEDPPEDSRTLEASDTRAGVEEPEEHDTVADELAPDEDDPFADEVEMPAAKPETAPESVHRRVPQAWGNVVTDVFSLPVEPTYKRLVQELTLGNDVTQYANVLHALEQSSRNAFDAARLVRAAKRADEEHTSRIDERLEAMRTKARDELETEKGVAKDKGKAVKAATLQEVADRMIRDWPDEVRSLNASKSEMHGAMRAIEGLEKAWWDRCQTLRQIANRFTNRS